MMHGQKNIKLTLSLAKVTLL